MSFCEYESCSLQAFINLANDLFGFPHVSKSSLFNIMNYMLHVGHWSVADDIVGCLKNG